MGEHETQDTDQLAIDTIRFLAVDMVEKAKSGHPGAPLGQAPLAYLLWTRHLRHNPDNPDWPNRDRFVLSCGHASALLYSLLHLARLRPAAWRSCERFRQFGSKTPGHPEHELTRGVETTTGPLGQGHRQRGRHGDRRARCGAAHFNRDGFPLFDHRIWVIASDGDLMEGVASEACSLAGHLRARQAQGLLRRQRDLDRRPDLARLLRGRGQALRGLRLARPAGRRTATTSRRWSGDRARPRPRPSGRRWSSSAPMIGYGSPNKAGTAEAHGAPLGADEVTATKQALGWPHGADLPGAGRGARAVRARRASAAGSWSAEWNELLRALPRGASRSAAAELDRPPRRQAAGRLGRTRCRSFEPGGKPIATRAASGKVLNAHRRAAAAAGRRLGRPDAVEQHAASRARPTSRPTHPEGRNLRFGVREHAMGAILNGIALSRLWIPYGGTFLIFSDYMRPPIRLAALMKLQAIYVFTHDSIFLGEDGPTHQPIEQLAVAARDPGPDRDPPGRRQRDRRGLARRDRAPARPDGAGAHPAEPADPGRDRASARAEGVPRGGYVLARSAGGEPEVDPDRHRLGGLGRPSKPARRWRARASAARVVSMPSWELFDAQPQEYRDSVLPPAVRKRLAVEAGRPLRLAQVRRRSGRDPRHRALRRLGPVQGPGRRIRLHRREGGGAGGGDGGAYALTNASAANVETPRGASPRRQRRTEGQGGGSGARRWRP